MLTQIEEQDLADRFNEALHAPCKSRKRLRRECVWTYSSYCYYCGRAIPTLLDNRPGTIS